MWKKRAKKAAEPEIMQSANEAEEAAGVENLLQETTEKIVEEETVMDAAPGENDLPEVSAESEPDEWEEPQAEGCEQEGPSGEPGREAPLTERENTAEEMTGADAVTIPFQARKERKTHKKFKIFVLTLVLTLLAGAAAVFFYFQATAVKEVNLTIMEMTMREGESFPLRYELIPMGANDDLDWESSAPYVASVANGVVTAVSEGSCTITVTANSGAKDMCRITVRQQLMEEEQSLLGEWKLYATSDLGRIKYYYGSAYSLHFYSDRTGYLVENEERTDFEWAYEETFNGYESYMLSMDDGRKLYMERNTNTGTVMNNTLSLQFSDELLWVFIR